MTPRRRKRKLLLRGEKDNNDYLVTMLSKVDYIYDKTSLTTNEQSCVTAVNNFYAAYDSNDNDNFDMYSASPLSTEVLGVKMDALETAVNNL